MRKVSIRTVILLSALAPFSSFAAQQETTSTVTDLYVFPQSAGDISLKMVTPAPGCFGFWMGENDPGFKTVYALLLAAYASQTPIRIAGSDTTADRWLGSGDHYCKFLFVGGVSSS